MVKLFPGAERLQTLLLRRHADVIHHPRLTQKNMSYIWRAAHPSWITHSEQGGPSALQLRRCGVYNFHKDVFIGQTTLPLAPYLMSSGPKKVATSLNLVYYHILALRPCIFLLQHLSFGLFGSHIVSTTSCLETFKEDFLAELV